ncbi:MAG: DUF4012 domain-containing protein [Actinomycetota bacterium]|nr:DUF4012 domain-containing protein [Actinomycetota bacterium]
MASENRIGVVSATVVVAALAATWLWVSMLSAPWDLATGLLDASEHFKKAENKLQAQAMKEARYETLAGVAAATRARSGYAQGGPVLDLAAGLPVVGEALEEVDHLIKAAELTGEAAVGTLDVAQNALRGPEKVIAKDPTDEEGGAQIRIDRIREIGETISGVRAAIEGVRGELEAVKLSNLPSRARSAITDGIDKASQTDTLLADAEAGFQILPGFLGENETRMYLFGMQNSAEQRGPGGALLQFKLMQIADGKPELLDTGGTVYNIDKNRKTFDIALPEDAWYVRTIEDAQRFGNANWSPDWPLSAKLTVDYAKAAVPNFPNIDGVIGVDPMLMEKLMPGVGKFKTTGKNVFVDEDRIVHFLLYKAYASYPIPKVRRNHLQAVVNDFYVHMLKPKHPTEVVDGFGSALREKHMQVYLTDPAEQRFIERMNWDGEIEQKEPGDYLYVVEQNVGGNKLDYFTQHANRVHVQFDGDDAAVTTEISIENRVFFPQPLYPMGDTGRVAATNGHHFPMMNVYVPRDAQLRLADVDGVRIDSPPGAATWPSPNQPAEHYEKGKKVWTATMDIPPGDTGTFRLGYVTPGAVVQEAGRKVYRLTVQRQPRVRPEQLIVRVGLPQGAKDIAAKGWKREGNDLVWDRPLKEDIVLEVSWRS